MDKCKDCPKMANYPCEGECPVCGAEAIVEYSEPSIIWKCEQCGGLVGDGFWTACQSDSEKYNVRIAPESYSQKQKYQIAKLCNWGVAMVYDNLQKHLPISQLFELPECATVCRQLFENRILFVVDPPLEYSHYSICHEGAELPASVVIASEMEQQTQNGQEENLDELLDNWVKRYGWEAVERAFCAILLDDAAGQEKFELCANCFWLASLNYEIKNAEKAIALLYYRLGNVKAPYENNTLWSFVSEVYHLDYCCSEYNPLKDEKILKTLADLGLL